MIVRRKRPYPTSVEDLQRLARESGIPGDVVWKLDITPTNALPTIEGYLNSLRIGESQVIETIRRLTNTKDDRQIEIALRGVVNPSPEQLDNLNPYFPDELPGFGM